jgi:hypothetical protein
MASLAGVRGYVRSTLTGRSPPPPESSPFRISLAFPALAFGVQRQPRLASLALQHVQIFSSAPLLLRATLSGLSVRELQRPLDRMKAGLLTQRVHEWVSLQ